MTLGTLLSPFARLRLAQWISTLREIIGIGSPTRSFVDSPVLNGLDPPSRWGGPIFVSKLSGVAKNKWISAIFPYLHLINYTFI